MRIDILTLFPEMFECLNCSIIGRAREENKVEINIINIRDFSKDKHKKCDDTPFGGGAGMVMTPAPLFDAINSVKGEKSLVVLTSPRGQTFNQTMVESLAKEEHLVIVCGHYEGVDERIIDLCVDREISIGDFVLTGGEIPAMAMVDAIARYLPNVIKKDSLSEESFSNFLLEYPQYTRPQIFQNLAVPDVLISGHHDNIKKWRLEKSLEITKKNRPDLYKKYAKTKKK